MVAEIASDLIALLERVEHPLLALAVTRRSSFTITLAERMGANNSHPSPWLEMIERGQSVPFSGHCPILSCIQYFRDTCA